LYANLEFTQHLNNKQGSQNSIDAQDTFTIVHYETTQGNMKNGKNYEATLKQNQL
jgi:hypothetical protein